MDERPWLALILDAVGDFVVVFDDAWRCAYANAPALRYIGAWREQVTGTVLWERFPELRDTELGRACLRVGETGVAEHVEAFDHRTSAFFAGEIHRTPVGVAVIARDITAEKIAVLTARRAAERMTLLQQTMARLVEATTRQEVTDVLVRACERMFGACAASLALVDEAPRELELPTPIRDAVRSGDVVIEGTSVTVPIALRGRTLGAMGLDFEGSPSFDEEQLELLRTVACAGIGALERLRLHECEEHLGKREVQLARQMEWANAELAAMFDNAPVGLNLLDRELRFRLVNRVCAEINGVAIEDHIGKTAKEVLPGLPSELHANLRRVLETGEIFDQDLTAETPAQPGRRRDWHVLYYPVRDVAGAIIGVATNVREVAADRGAERQRLRKAARDAAFVKATSVLLWVTDPYGHVPEDSPSWRAFTGMSFDDLMSPWGWAKALHPDDRERVSAAWSRATQSKSPFVCEQRFRRHDGAYVWTLARAAPVLDERGDIVEWVGTNMDISESKRAEEQREATLRFAEQFIGILGHDLRNPINAIQMAAQLLERKAESAGDCQRLVERIAASTTRMSDMVAQLLDLTRVRLGTGLRVERKAMNLSPVVTGVVEELGLVHPTRIVECACEAAVEGSWDADRLAQVVSNLVANALQHGDPARPVEVRLATVESGAVFEVQSYGTPIAPDLLPHIFDPYRQGQSRRGKSQGLGLGLFITQEIVHAHGGRIEVRSTAAEGTRFTVTLPRS